MIPFGLSKEQFVKRYRGCLNKASRSFIASLRELFSVPVPDTIKEAEVQIFLGDDGTEAPDAWIYFQGENNKVDSSDPSIFPCKSLKLPSFAKYILDFDEKYYEEEFGGAYIIANVTKEWLAECWWKAGGWSYSVPVVVWVHDDFGDGNSIELSEHH